MKAKTDELVRRFLLGDLSEEERLQLERRFLADNEFFEQVLSAEDALLDQYILDRLSEADQERAKTLFESSPSQNQMVTSARELIALVQKSRETSTPAGPTAVVESPTKLQLQPKTTSSNPLVTDAGPSILSVSADARRSAGHFTVLTWVVIAITGITLVAGILYKHFQMKTLEGQSFALEQSGRKVREELQTETQRGAELSKQLEIEKQKRMASEALVAQLRSPGLTGFTSITLSPTTVERGGNSQIVRVRSETRPIQLRLQLDTGQRYSRYSLLITTFDGHRVWSVDLLNSNQIKRGRLNVVLSSSLLKPEDYRIALTGLEDTGDATHVADYIFKIRR
jgi:hypothetical protein